MTVTSLESTKDSAAAVSDRAVAAGPVRFFSQFTMSSASLPAIPQTNASSCQTGYHPSCQDFSLLSCAHEAQDRSAYAEYFAYSKILSYRTGIPASGSQKSLAWDSSGKCAYLKHGLLTGHVSPVCLHCLHFLEHQCLFSSGTPTALTQGYAPGDVGLVNLSASSAAPEQD